MSTSVNWVEYSNSAEIGQNPTIVDYLNFTQNSPPPNSTNWSKPYCFGFECIGSNIDEVGVWGDPVAIDRNTLKPVNITASNYKLKAIDQDNPYILEVDYISKCSYPFFELIANVNWCTGLSNYNDGAIPSNKLYDGVLGDTTGPYFYDSYGDTDNENSHTNSYFWGFSKAVPVDKVVFSALETGTGKLWYSNNNTSWTRLTEDDYVIDPVSGSETFTVNLAEAVTAKYFRLTIEGVGSLYCTEFVVYYLNDAYVPNYVTTRNIDTYVNLGATHKGFFIIDGDIIDTNYSGTKTIILKDQENPVENGIYTLTYGSGAYTLTRHSLFNGAYSYLNNVKFHINDGDSNVDTFWTMTFAPVTASLTYDVNDINLGNNTTKIYFYKILSSTTSYVESPSVRVAIGTNVGSTFTNRTIRQQNVTLKNNDLILLFNQNITKYNGYYQIQNANDFAGTCDFVRKPNLEVYLHPNMAVLAEEGEAKGLYSYYPAVSTPQEFLVAKRRVQASNLALVDSGGITYSPNDFVFNSAKLGYDAENEVFTYDLTGATGLSETDDSIFIYLNAAYSGYYTRREGTEIFEQYKPYPSTTVLVEYAYTINGVYTRTSYNDNFVAGGSCDQVKGYMVSFLNEKETVTANSLNVEAYKISNTSLTYHRCVDYTFNSETDTISENTSNPNEWTINSPDSFVFKQYSTTPITSPQDDYDGSIVYYYRLKDMAEETQNRIYLAISKSRISTENAYLHDFVKDYRYIHYYDSADSKHYYWTLRYDTLVDPIIFEWHPYYLMANNIGFVCRTLDPVDFESSGFGNPAMIQFWNNLPTSSGSALTTIGYKMDVRQKSYSGRYVFSYKQPANTDNHLTLRSYLKNSL